MTPLGFRSEAEALAQLVKVAQNNITFIIHAPAGAGRSAGAKELFRDLDVLRDHAAGLADSLADSMADLGRTRPAGRARDLARSLALELGSARRDCEELASRSGGWEPQLLAAIRPSLDRAAGLAERLVDACGPEPSTAVPGCR